MATTRRFARLARSADRPFVYEVPNDGMCLSAFLVVRPPSRPHEVLVGRMKATDAWEHAAGVHADRIRSTGDRWVLPASQLVFFERPDEAARRIAAEQLHLADLPLGSPRVFSEAYPRRDGPQDPHWDLHFVYTVDRPSASPPPRGELWQELTYVDVRSTPASAFGRGHGDVLALVGLAPSGTATPL